MEKDNNHDPITDQKVLRVARDTLAREANRYGLDVADYIKALNEGKLPSHKGIRGFFEYLSIYRKKK
jgi:hypothetical protein